MQQPLSSRNVQREKKSRRALLAVVLFLLAFVLGWMALGTLVSKKYEVEEQYWQIDGRKDTGPAEKAALVAQLEAKGAWLEVKAGLSGLAAVVSIVVALALLIRTQRSQRPLPAAEGFQP